MHRISQSLCVAALALAAATSAVADDDQWIRGEIEVIETHIFRVDDRLLRLMGVDAPIEGQPCAPHLAYKADCGKLHRFTVEQSFGGKRVQCRLASGSDWRNEPDRATCYHGSTDVNAVLVAMGMGMADRSETYRYVPYERLARKKEIGLWSEDAVTVPREWAYQTNEWQYPRIK